MPRTLNRCGVLWCKLNLKAMPKQKATRTGAVVRLPKYCNAEMLTLEYFDGVAVVITPVKHPTLTVMSLRYEDGHMSATQLDGLIDYINANI